MRSTVARIRHHSAMVAAGTLLLFCFATVLQAAPMAEYERLQPITTNLNAPTAVALDAHGNVYVTQSIYNNLLVYDRNGVYKGSLSGLARPISVAVAGDGRVLVGNKDRGNVEVYDVDLSAMTFSLHNKLGSGDGEFAQPSGIAVSSAGNVYVADGKADWIKVYGLNGTFQFSFGTSGSGDGQFNFPTSVAIDEPAGEIVVTDLPLIETWSGIQEGARIQVFDMNGGFLRSFGEFGQGEGKLTKPLGVAVDEESRIYATDAFQNVVQVFDSDGTYLGAVYDLANPMRTPLGVAFARTTDRLFIASLNTSRVEVYRLIGPCYDLTGDGEVGVGDVNAVADLWRQPADYPYDTDGNGIVNIVDIATIVAQWGMCN